MEAVQTPGDLPEGAGGIEQHRSPQAWSSHAAPAHVGSTLTLPQAGVDPGAGCLSLDSSSMKQG